MLKHRTVFEDEALIAKKLPFTEELREHHEDGYFHLVHDPLVRKEALIIGMFVLRPALAEPYTSRVLNDEGRPESLFDPAHDWAFNISGLDGGWIVADSSPVDAYRLGLQYGLSDAVMAGSGTEILEGVAHGDNPGHARQPYIPFSWNHVASNDPNVNEKLMRQRQAWQQLGYLSSREYPAQILVTWSGVHRDDSPHDFLACRMFHTPHPNGKPVEAYILTSEDGANAIRARCHKFNLQDRIEDILIVLPSAPGMPRSHLDLKQLPALLFNKYDIRIVNHDGGQATLKEFSNHGIVHQLNLTLARCKTLHQVLVDRKEVDSELKEKLLADFPKRISYYFNREDKDIKSHGIPSALRVASVLESNTEDVAVCTFVPPAGDFHWWK